MNGEFGESGARSFLRACLSAGVLFAAQSGQESAGKDASDGHIAYVTTNASLHSLELGMAQHYLELSRQGSLPVQRVRDDIGLAPRQLMYALGLVRGSAEQENYPLVLDRLTCTLNRKLCSLDAGGRPRWRNRKHDVLCLPAVQWRDAFGLTSIALPATVDQLERRLGSCSALGGDCARLAAAIANAPPDATEISVPVLSQAAYASAGEVSDCSQAGQSEASASLDEIGRRYLEQAGMIVPLSQHEVEPAAETGVAELSGATDAAASAAALAASNDIGAASDLQAMIELPHADPHGRVEATDAPVGPPPAPVAPSPPPEVLRISRVIESLPEPTEGPVPSPARTPATATAPAAPVPSPSAPVELDGSALALAGVPGALSVSQNVTVFVFDTEVNSEHALLSHDRRVGRCAGAPVFQLDLEPSAHADHGTHVSALIGGCLLGVNPYARLAPVTLVSEAGQSFDFEMAETISRALWDHRVTERIANFSYNLSQPDPQVRDKLADVVRDTKGILFVAAAGNEPVSLEDGCETLPACLALGKIDNLLVVGGLAARQSPPMLWARSARSARYVDLLAPAENVMSAVRSMPQVGRLSGTSQSAAIVSGIASLVFAASADGFPSKPQQVKHRLMATARIVSELEGYARSGMVDAKRALATQQWLVVEENGARLELEGEYLGMVNQLGGDAPPTVAFEISGREESLSLCRVYRLSRTRPDHYFIAHEPVGRNQGGWWEQAEFAHDAKLKTYTKSILFRDRASGEAKAYPLPRVVEFYDAFSTNRPCDPTTRRIAHAERD
jgi:subtilisin family serine protease